MADTTAPVHARTAEAAAPSDGLMTLVDGAPGCGSKPIVVDAEPAGGIVPRAGSLPELLRLLGAPVRDADRHPATLDGPRLTVLRVASEAALLHEGAQGKTLYVVRSGSFKCIRTLEDGYEQVLSFAQAGDLLGFEALHGGAQQSSILAMEFSTVYALSVRELRSMRQAGTELGDAVRQGLSRQLARSAETTEMMSAVASDARLARFILWLSLRMAAAGQSPRRILLRMGRRDIASLLGLAHETVSRSFTVLAEGGCLKVDNREVEILDMAALRVRARCTRGSHLEDTQRRPEAGGERLLATPGWWCRPSAAVLA